MNEYRDIEDRLRQVRPLGPSERLRVRVMQVATRRSTRVRDWLLPLAAAAAALVLYALAAQVRARALSDAGSDPMLDAAVEALTEQLGGGPLAQYLASRVVSTTFVEEAPVE